MLGRDVVRVAEHAGHEVVGLAPRGARHHATPGPSSAWSRAERPEALINCAAWTDVDGAEEQPRPRRRRVNGAGARNLAAATAAVGCKIVFPSTDYVFDGEQGGAVRRVRPGQPAVGIRQVEARRARARRSANNPRHFIVRVVVAVRRQRQELRRHDAGPRPHARRGRGRDGPGRLPDLHGASRRGAGAPGRMGRLRHLPHGRRRRVLVVRVRGRDLRAGGRRLPRAVGRPPTCSTGRRRGPPTRCS